MSENKLAFIGAGLIGSGLAINAITHGIPAAVQTRSQVERTTNSIENGIKFLLAKGIIDEAQAEKARSLYTVTTSIEEACKGATMIQESGPDKMELKHSIIAQIEAAADPEAIICTSTSSQSITAVFSEAQHPERCMGGHPYNPAYIIPLVEITKGEKTDDKYAQKAKEIYTEMGKVPVLLNKESIGFIANRYQSAIHRECVDLVENGVCSVEDADKALVYGVGIRWALMGQFLTLDLGVGEGGIGKFNEKYGVDVTKPDGRLSHMPTWTTFPADWCEVAAPGLAEEIAHRDPATGQDQASIAAWRDDMLVEILRLHKLL